MVGGAALAFGVGVGAYGTLIGAGGGFLVVPALLFLWGTDARVAAGTSLVVVAMNAASGTAAYAARRLVHWRTVAVLALATVPGAWLGPMLLERIPQDAFQALFGALLLALSGWLALRPSAPDSGGGIFEPAPRALAWGAAASLLVGFLSSLLGIGGGFLHVPFLVYALKYPFRIAVATSQATLLVTAAVGVAGHARLRHVFWEPALLIGLGAMAGAQAGAWISGKLGYGIVARLLSAAVGLVGIRCLWEAVR